jgi:lysophospholipase L1-like esterase
VNRLRALCAASVVLWMSSTAMPTGQAGPGEVVGVGDEVVGVGDSILQEMAPQVDSRLREFGWSPHLSYMGGTGLTTGTPAWQLGATFDWAEGLRDLEARYDPEVVVIVLGTNDVFSVSEGEDYAPHIDRMLAVTDAPRVRWTTCDVHSQDLVRNAACTEINADLYAVKREGFQVVPLDEEVYVDPANVTEDGVHLSAAGAVAGGDLIARAVGPK